MMRINSLYPLLFFFTLALVTHIDSVEAQTRAKTKELSSKDVRLVKNLPSVYVSYVREGIRDPLHVGDSDKGIWLRFHNNSIWQVGICTFDVPNGYGETGINYEVERFNINRKSAEIPIGYEAKGGCSLVFIRPGKSLLFSLPREHLAKGLAIKIQFRYEWEIDPDGFVNEREAKHYAYFYSSDVTKSKIK
jgi:hypothetical protein